MAQPIFKRGPKNELKNEPLQDGLLSFTTDDGKIHLDVLDDNNQLKRLTFYSGKLTIGPHIFDGTEDVNVNIYDGEVNDKNK